MSFFCPINALNLEARDIMSSLEEQVILGMFVCVRIRLYISV